MSEALTLNRSLIAFYNMTLDHQLDENKVVTKKEGNYLILTQDDQTFKQNVNEIRTNVW